MSSCRWACLMLAFLLLAGYLSSQEYRGSMTGRVLDPTGAAVPGARVTATNTATNVPFVTNTNVEGNYTIPYLQPGTYSLRVERTGFKVFERSPIDIRINQVVRVDAQLELGSASETVTVSAETPLLDTGSASVGQTIDSRRLEELPIQQGVAWHMIALSAGVVKTGTNMLDENPYDGTPTYYSVQGASATANLITIDGAMAGRGVTNFTPPQDAIGEMRVLTSNYDASQGFTQGANVSVSLRSGTNTPHGSASWYGGGNGSLIANQYFNVVNGRPKSPSGPYFRRNFAFGGPAYIPKVYDGRSRTFFFLSYEGIHRTQVLTQSFTVPGVKQRQGDFSELLALGANYQLYDPYSRQPAPGGRVSSSPLPGNIVPKSRQDPIGMGLLQYWPLPNQSGNPDGTNNWYCNQSGQSNQYWGMTFRLDQNFSERFRMFGSFHRSDRDNQDYDILQNGVSGDSWKMHPRGGVLDGVYVVTPSFIMDARMGIDRYDRLIDALGPKALNWRYADNGFPAYMDRLVDPSIKRMPSFSPAGIVGIPPGATLSVTITNYYSSSVHFAKSLASHNIKFGWEMLVRQDASYAPGIGATGSFNFNGTYLRGPLDNSPAAPIGQGLAQMEYGLPTTSSINRVPSAATQSYANAVYLQEDWRLTPQLTINLGLRYERWGALSERFNRTQAAGWDPNAQPSIATAAEAAYLSHPIPELSQLKVRGGLLFAGVNGQPHALWPANHDFMPRLGLSYSLNNKTVIHTGYGIFYAPGGRDYQDIRQTGFSRTTTTNASKDNGLTYPYPLSDPFPEGVLEPTGASLGVDTALGTSITLLNPAPKGSYIQRWAFDVQRELPGRLAIRVGYAGTRQTRLSTTKNLNALPNSYLSKSPVRDQATIDYLTTNVPNPFYGLPLLAGTSLGTNTTVARTQLLVPYPHFTGVSIDTQQGYAWYHGLLLTAERRMAKGLTAQLSYTYSKAMEATSFLNGGDPVPSEMIASVDRPHYLAASAIYELPIGRGRALLGRAPRIVDALAGGWQIQGVYRFQSGEPLGFTNPLIDWSKCSSFRDVALPSDQRNYKRWFNTDCFVRASSLQLSYNLQTVPPRWSWLRGDALNVMDLGGIKRFKLTERMSLEFKLEVLNALNREWLGSFANNPTSGTFGQAGREQSAPRRVYWSGRLEF